MAFLHGVETQSINKGPVPVTVVRSGVIGLLGISPKGSVNTPILVTSAQEAAQFGSQLPGFNIPKALADIFAQGAGAVIVVNVFNDTSDVLTVTAETHVITAGKTKTTYPPVKDFVLKDSAGTITFVKDTDYTVDDFGNIVVLNFTAIPEASTVKADYKRLDTTAIDNAQLIGTISGSDVYTGAQCWDLAYNLFGMRPKLLMAPGYTSITAIRNELQSKADKYRGFCLIDAPAATTVAVAIAGRGPAGAINFFTSHKRTILCYPYMKAFDTYSNADEIRPMSQFAGGLIANNDNVNGYWFSPSNKEFKGVTGVERTISWALNDTNSNANKLNEVGICTVASGFGTGYRFWGNRSALYPSATTMDNFIAVLRTADVVDESVEQACLQFIDLPINNGLIDSIQETVNSFIRTLVGRGALVDGNCYFDPADNPPVEIAAGHLTFTNSLAPPIPGERITFKSVLDVNLLKTLIAQ